MAEEDAEVRGRIETMHAADVAARELGIRLRAVEVGGCTVTLVVAEKHLGSLGQLHGGVLFTLADVAMSYASNSRGATAMAIRASIDFIDGASIGDELVATAVEHSLRGKSAIYDVTIRSGTESRLVATFRGNTLRLG